MKKHWVAVIGVVALLAGALVSLGVPGAGAASPAVFSVGSASLLEGDGVLITRELKIPVTLSDASLVQTKVSYTVSGVTATAGSDFVAIVGTKTLTFNAGVVKKVITVKVIPDTVPESTETLSVTLSNPIGGPGLLRTNGTGTILDGDPSGGLTVSAGDVTVVEGDTGGGVSGTIAQFPVTLNATSGSDVTVQYSTGALNATPGVDFTAIPLRTLKFKAGTYKKYVTVKVTRDSTPEVDEFIWFVLSAPSAGLSLVHGIGTGAFVDDDPPDAPMITGTSPASPSASATPSVIGTAETGTTVRLYLNGSCAGSPAATGSAATLAGSGIGVTVPTNATTTITARAVDGLGLLSPCSPSASYTNATVIRTGLAWGRGDVGQIGDGNTNLRTLSPTVVLPGAKVVAAGSITSYAIKGDGTLWTWGSNQHGELGDTTPTGRTTPAQVGSDTHWVRLAAGDEHVLALKDDGSLWAWGSNGIGQVGDGTQTDRSVPTHIGSSTWTAIGAGMYHSLAVRTDGTLWAWGHNGQGQLGDGTTTHRFLPTQVGTDTNWTEVDAGFAHSVARRTDGTVWSFGWNQFGQLGDGTATNSSVPVQVGTDVDWASVNAGGDSTLATKADGTLWSWGDNTAGTLGRTGSGLSPAQVGADTDWDRVSLSPCSNFTPVLAIKSGGTLWGWGYNWLAQLGLGSFFSVQATPTQVGTATDWSTVVAGCEHSLGVEST